MSDQAVWIHQAREGDAGAFGDLVQMYQTPVYNLACRMLGDRVEAEDAAQEAFLRAFDNLHRYDPGRSFRTWILSIAAHHCVDRLRRRRPTTTLNESVMSAAGSDPERIVVQRESREQIQRLLNELPPTDRATIVLRYWYDVSYDEIAEILDLTASAVKSRLHRARRTLARELQEEADGM